MAVVKSLAVQNEMTPAFAGLVWLRRVLDAEAATRGKPRVLLSYEGLLEDWEGATRQTATSSAPEWPLAINEAAADVNAYLLRDLQHHAPSFAGLTSDPEIAAWVKTVCEALTSLHADKESPEALAMLDRVRAEFEKMAPIFGRATFPELAARERHLGFLAVVKQAEVTRLSDDAKADKERIDELSRALEQEKLGRFGFAELENRLAERAAAVAAAEGERDLTLAQLRTTEAALSGAQSMASRLQNQVADLENALKCKAINQRALEASLQASKAALEKLKRSVSWRITSPIRLLWRAHKRMHGGLEIAWRALRAIALRRAKRMSEIGLIEKSGLFDRTFYLNEYPDVAATGIDPLVHFVTIGAKEGRNPSPYFDTVFYARQIRESTDSTLQNKR